jgi:hypothetical protein
MTTQTNENFFQRLWNGFLNLFTNEVPAIEHKIAKFADTVTNDLKAALDNPAVQAVLSTLESIAETIDPQLTPMIQGLNLEIPKILNFVTGVTSVIDAEAAKPVEQQILDALEKLKIIKADTSTGAAVYAGILGTISTAIQHYVTQNNGILATPAQLITSAQAVHAAV